MFTEAKETKTHKYVLLTALIALAVIISLAVAGKANAAESDIESIKYEPAKQEYVHDIGYFPDFPNDEDEDAEGQFFSYFNPYPYPYLGDLTIDDFYAPKDFEDRPISTNDKLIITRKDGSVQTLSPRYNWYIFGANSEDGRPCIAWVDVQNNEITDVDADFSWNNLPGLKKDNHLMIKVFEPGTYDNTVTVKVGDKSTTFNKKIVITGSKLSSYDKTVPVLSNKVVKTGIRKTKGTIIDGFWIRWPGHKNDDSYAVKLKQFFPKSSKSSKYVTFNQAFNSEFNVVETTSSMLESGYGYNFTEWRNLTTDTMMEISVSVIKKSNPEKTGSMYVYGKYSKPARVFLSKNKTLKAKGKKKSVKLTWSKVKKASGYKIKYSTKKNMSKAKTINVKGGNKKAYTIKKLKKNKKYYFQITPYKVYKGKTYTGYASAKKAAKAK